MKITVACVGSPSRLMAGPIREYEERAARYWKLEWQELRPEKASRNRPDADIMAAEGGRLRAAVPEGAEIVALTRSGKAWSSERMARYLQELALRSAPGAAFLIGGALGLDPALTSAATHRLSLSSMTMPHDLARLVLAEQLYRAGTIARGEPYHKG